MDMVHSRALGPDRGRLLNDDVRHQWLNELFGGQIGDITLYDRALTHGSTGSDDYQRLEFLGDRVLGLVMSEALYAYFPDEAEGRLSHRLNGLVSGMVCADVARSLNVSPHMIIGKQARDDGVKDSDNVLGDVMEALLGALYVDKGLEAAREFVMTHWKSRMTAAQKAPKHPKSELQEWCAIKTLKNPLYEVTGKEGPPHNMRFKVTVTVKGFDPVSAEAASKQAAETAAAIAFLEKHK